MHSYNTLSYSTYICTVGNDVLGSYDGSFVLIEKCNAQIVWIKWILMYRYVPEHSTHYTVCSCICVQCKHACMYHVCICI